MFTKEVSELLTKTHYFKYAEYQRKLGNLFGSVIGGKISGALQLRGVVWIWGYLRIGAGYLAAETRGDALLQLNTPCGRGYFIRRANGCSVIVMSTKHGCSNSLQ